MKKTLSLILSAAVSAPAAFAAGARTATLDVDNMDCSVCPITVREALKKVLGVTSAKVDFKAKRAVVVFDGAKATPDSLTKATADAGFPSKIAQLQ